MGSGAGQTCKLVEVEIRSRSNPVIQDRLRLEELSDRIPERGPPPLFIGEGKMCHRQYRCVMHSRVSKGYLCSILRCEFLRVLQIFAKILRRMHIQHPPIADSPFSLLRKGVTWHPIQAVGEGGVHHNPDESLFFLLLHAESLNQSPLLSESLSRCAAIPRGGEESCSNNETMLCLEIYGNTCD